MNRPGEWEKSYLTVPLKFFLTAMQARVTKTGEMFKMQRACFQLIYFLNRSKPL